jgi:hypothetical protein
MRNLDSALLIHGGNRSLKTAPAFQPDPFTAKCYENAELALGAPRVHSPAAPRFIALAVESPAAVRFEARK